MASSLTLLSAEVEGRSYGGGVMKLETKEAERLLVPILDAAAVAQLEGAFPEMSALVSAGNVEAAARLADDVLGLDHDVLWNAYLAFRSRRLGRRRARAA
jgi:hypothetical protein